MLEAPVLRRRSPHASPLASELFSDSFAFGFLTEVHVHPRSKGNEMAGATAGIYYIQQLA